MRKKRKSGIAKRKSRRVERDLYIQKLRKAESEGMKRLADRLDASERLRTQRTFLFPE